MFSKEINEVNYRNIDKWFLFLLKERFDIDFVLLRKGNKVIISIVGSDSRLIINNIDWFLYKFANTSDIKCLKWKADEYGFIGIIDNEQYLLHGVDISHPLIYMGKNECILNFDILGMIYWVLNRLEEIYSNKLDHFSRFDSHYSHAYINNYLHRPIIDELFFILRQIIQKLWPNIKLKQHKFRFEISHDVDRPSRYSFKNKFNLLKSMLGDLRYGYIKDALYAPYIKFFSLEQFHNSDPYNTFEWIFDISERLHIENTFNFIAGGIHKNDADYYLNDYRIKKLMSKIISNGHKIGLHPSFNTYLDEQQLKMEFNLLKEQCFEIGIKQDYWTGRMHYLRWSHPETLQLLENIGLDCDSTLGYSREAGFRCGTCYEYTMFNPISYELLKLKEHPLIIMDVMLLQDVFLTKNEKEIAQDKIISLIEIVKKLDGNLTFLWHNSTLRNPFSKQLYQETLELLASS